MLKTLHIKDFAITQNLTIDFQSGLTIITGETGTGKSIIVGAISAVLGSRVFSEVVRTGAEKAMVEATFDINNLQTVKKRLQDKGLENNNELFLRREISKKGTTRAFINDTPVTITTLAEIGDFLVDLHGQNEHQSLLHKETHSYFLDSFGSLQEKKNTVKNKYHYLMSVLDELRSLERKQQILEEKYELYYFQREEIDKVKLVNGEEEKLIAERNILMNAEKIFSLSSEFRNITNGEDGSNLYEFMGHALHILKELSTFSEDLNGIYHEFSSAKIIVEEADRAVEEFQNKLEFNPVHLEEIEDRLSIISNLKKKYGNNVEEILEYRNNVDAQLNLKDNFDFELKNLNKKYQEAHKEYAIGALELSDARKDTANILEKIVSDQLKEIGMSKTLFKVNINWQEDKSGLFEHDQSCYAGDENGVDQIEFYISPNPGEDFKPLIKIASGGEISRIMLALKNILTKIDKIPLLVFDEIDIGVSGRIASAVGKSIHRLTDNHQVICITHLPQIASFGKTHFRVEKYVEKNRTFTKITLLDTEQRIEEIARLMGGEKINEVLLKSAKQLLQETQFQAQ